MHSQEREREREREKLKKDKICVQNVTAKQEQQLTSDQ